MYMHCNLSMHANNNFFYAMYESSVEIWNYKQGLITLKQ